MSREVIALGIDNCSKWNYFPFVTKNAFGLNSPLGQFVSPWQHYGNKMAADPEHEKYYLERILLLIYRLNKTDKKNMCVYIFSSYIA